MDTRPGALDEPAANLPRVAGFEIRPEHWAAFQAWYRQEPMDKVAVAAGVTPQTISNWRKTEWWQALYDAWLRPIQEDFVLGMVSQDAKVLAAYGEIVDGERSDDKSATAAANLIKLRTEIGKDPIVNRRPITNVNTGPQLIADEINVQLIQNMNQDELLEFNLSGKMPMRLIKVVEQE